MREEALELRAAFLAKPDYFVDNRTLYDPFEPTWNCHVEQRIGNEFGDGGKFICGLDSYFRDSSSCLVYSVGSSGDFTFEKRILEKFGCEVHTFDPTGDTVSWTNYAVAIGVNYHAWGLRGKSLSDDTLFNPTTNENNPLLSLMEIRTRLAHDGKKIDILKVDCEGCEWAAFQLIWDDIIEGKYRVGQVQIELHNLDFELIKGFFKHANQATFHIFHKERNHWGCNGYWCLEYALIGEEAALDIFRYTHC